MEEDELSYIQGNQRAWLQMLAECLRQLGYDVPEAAAARWVLERADAVLALRALCEAFGDNDWPDTLHLTDILNKHLRDYMEHGAE